MVDKESMKKVLVALEYKCFEDLVNEYQHSVFSTAYSFTNSLCDAEDLAQEVFLLVYRNITTFNFDAKLSTWIYRITLNKCLSYRRSIARRKSIAQMVPIDNSDTTTMKDKANVEKSVIDSENGDILRRAIYSIGDNYSVVIILKYFECLESKEIAQILSLPVRTVETRLYRGKKRLKKKLETINYRWEVN